MFQQQQQQQQQKDLFNQVCWGQSNKFVLAHAQSKPTSHVHYKLLKIKWLSTYKLLKIKSLSTHCVVEGLHKPLMNVVHN